MTTNFSAQKTELLAILFASVAAEKRGDYASAQVLNDMLLSGTATLETEILESQAAAESLKQN
jgi:hypothetical protein